MQQLLANLSKHRARPRGLWRFVLLSILVHAGSGMLWLGHAPTQIRLPAPELAVALSEIAVQPGTKAKTAAPVAPAAKSTPASEFKGVSSGAADPPAPDQNAAGQGDPQRRNHLQSLLRAAFEAQFVYPALARRQGWQGRVQIALRVEADGRFSELRVLQSSGHASLDHDALQTLQRIGQLAEARMWLDGRAMRVELPVVYRLLES